MFEFHVPEHDIYAYNKGFLYRYNDQLCKLTVCNKVRIPGFELSEGCKKFTAKGEAGNDEKLPSSIRRAKSRVFEYAMCNDFSFFCTLTFSPEKVSDRYDLDQCMKAFCKWLNNYNRNRTSVSYLLIPEAHKDGAWHIHGLISNIPEAHLREFQLTDILPAKIRQELMKGNQVFQWTAYDKKFGYCTLSPIRNKEAVCKYITKYITKELGETLKELNAHLYYHSQGLTEKELVYSAADCILPDPDYDGDYCKIKNATTPEELLPYFTAEEQGVQYDAS